jgi:hypothetical protein
MPRNLTLGTSTLRNRNRVTNKTRLRIIAGNIDADPLVLDEDEEKARVVSTAGVDAEDANVSCIFLFVVCLSGLVVELLRGAFSLAPPRGNSFHGTADSSPLFPF